MLSAPQPDEVVEVFTGETLEEAMAYAVTSLGPDLTVRRARRVRKGVQGLRGKETYEVVAIPAPRAASPADAVGSAFESLLHQAEQAEEVEPVPVRRTTRPAADAPPVVLASVPLPRTELFDQTLLPPIETPREAPREAPRQAPRAARPPAPAAPRPPAPRQARVRAASPRPAPRRTAEPSGWSRRTLSQLGVPRAVLAELPDNDPRSDVAWVRALTRALATAVPPYDADAPVVVSGVGLEGVLGIVAAGRMGLPPGTITYDGRTAPATATELALALRSEVLR